MALSVMGENPKDIFYDTHSLKAIYVGGRLVWEKNYGPIYTNQVKYQNCKLNKYRFLASIMDNNGYFVTPLLSCKVGDVIRITGYYNGGTSAVIDTNSQQKARFFKATDGKNAIKNMYLRKKTANDTINCSLNNGIMQFTVPSMNNCGAIELTLAQNFDGDKINELNLMNLIITINEPIITYRNLLMPYCKEWDHLKSFSGSSLVDSTHHITNYIPYSNGDNYLTAGCKIYAAALYDSNKNFIATVPLTQAGQDNYLYLIIKIENEGAAYVNMIRAISSNAAYVRFEIGDFNPKIRASILTRNQPFLSFN